MGASAVAPLPAALHMAALASIGVLFCFAAAHMAVFIVYLILQDGSVHDYLFDQESCDWVHWTATVPAQDLPASLNFNEIIVQTIDTVRYSYLMRLLITHGHHTLFTGKLALDLPNTGH